MTYPNSLARDASDSSALIATVVAIGALDELRQAVIPGRTADAFDFLADACAGIGTTTTLLLYARRTTPDR